MFAFIPPELRLRIWREALSCPRVLPVDVCLDTAMASWLEGDRRHRGYAVFGGSFHLSRTVDISKVVSPVKSLSLVCIESRQVAVKMFPDLMVAEETPTPDLVLRRRGSRERLCRKPAGNRERLVLRCNLREDIFLFSDVDVNYWHVQSNEHFALTMYELFELAGESIADAQQFRQQLSEIRQAACPEKYLPSTSYSLAAMDRVHVLLAGLGGLDIFHLAVGLGTTHLHSVPANLAEIIDGQGFVDPTLRTVPLRQFVDIVLATDPDRQTSLTNLLTEIYLEGKRRIGWSPWGTSDDAKLRSLTRVQILKLLCWEP